MQIDEMLHIAGDLSLKSFTWGQGMVDTLNNLFADARQITVEITGNQALTMIRALPPPALVGVLEIQISTSTGRPVGEPAPPAKVEGKTEEVKTKRSIAPFVVGAVIVTISLIMAATMAVTANKTGQAPDEGVLKLILNTLVEVLKLFINPSTTPPAPALFPAY